MKLHLLCSTNRIPLSYELTPANVADISLTEELINEAALGEGVARRLLADLAYSSEQLREALAEVGILLATESNERVRPDRFRDRSRYEERRRTLAGRSGRGDRKPLGSLLEQR